MKRLCLGLAGLTLSATCAAYQISEDATEGTAYFGGAVGQSTINWTNPPATLGGNRFCFPDATECEDKPIGFKLFVGRMFTRNLGVEVGYYNTGDAEQSVSTGSTSSFAQGLRMDGLNLQGVAVLPLGPVSLQARAGFAVARTTRDDATTSGAAKVVIADDHTSFEPTFGVGIGYDFMKNAGVRLDWDRVRGRSDAGEKFEADMFTLGVLFRF